MRYFCVVGRHVMMGALPRLTKVSADNTIGVLIAIAAIAYSAHLRTWSKQTFVNNLWETTVAPVLLVACLLFSVHLVQSAWEIYGKHRCPFFNALGTTTVIPRWHLRWRLYLATLLYLSVPISLFLFIWFPFFLTISSPFIVDPNTNLLLPDLHVLNGLPYTPPPDKDKTPPTLLDLFNNDYPADHKAQNDLKMRGSEIPLKQQVYLDFLGKGEFVGFYIPSTHQSADEQGTFAICKSLAREVQPMLNTVRKNLGMVAGFGSSNTLDLRDLVFTKNALIYYQDVLSITEQAEIIERFKAEDVDVQFRGPDYEAFRDNVWFQNHKKQ